MRVLLCAVLAAVLSGFVASVAQAQTGQAGHKAMVAKTILSYARSVGEDQLVFVSLSASPKAKRLNGRLRNLLMQVERHYKRPVLISSGCRSKGRNRRAGGARKSYHLRCMAADIKVSGVSKSRLLRFVRSLNGRGGVGTYCRNSIVHIDVGPRREWHQKCRRRS